MSPVNVFVAVAVTQMFAGRLLSGANVMGVLPLASVVTVVEPIDVSPWPKPEGSGIWPVKNWISYEVLGRLFRVPWIELEGPPPIAVVKIG